MQINRRRFLALSGLALGACSSAAVTQIADAGQPQTATLAAEPIPVGPVGLYAPGRGDVRLVIISDLNSQYGSTEYRPEVLKGVELIPDWQPDLVLCGGDMVAGQKLGLTQTQITTMWAAFDRQILNPLRQAGLPFALTLGNHDASSSQSQGKFVFELDRQEAARYWQAHQAALDLQYVDAAHFPFYYSFLQNDIFYLIWDASSATVSAAQVAWAERSLGSRAAQAAKMRVVLGHLPFYAVSQGRDRNGEILNQADTLRALLERYTVHTYISGHQHAYFPGHAGQLDLLHCGALGSGPRPWLNRNDAPFQTLTVWDIFWASASTTYTTYNMNTLEPVNLTQLPRQIVGPNGRVLRQDVAWADLSEAERKQGYVPSR
jgi:3',5'-cyclic AMP phosphodiesterase CpdA